MVAKRKPKLTKANGNGANGHSGPVLEVKNLKTQFQTQDGTVKAVDDVSFYVMPGETLGVVGESGCGKSMTGLSIMRLIPNPPGKIVAGEILFNGNDILTMSDEEVRSIRGNEIAMIFQDPMTSLNPVLTVNRQISEALEALNKLRTANLGASQGELATAIADCILAGKNPAKGRLRPTSSAPLTITTADEKVRITACAQ